MLRGLKHILVSARGTSSKCPTCNRRLRKKTYGVLRCPEHGLMEKRLLASWNLAKKGLAKLGCGGVGFTMKASSRCKPKKQ